MANKVKANIAGRQYRLVSEDSRDYMLQIAGQVDQKIREILDRNPACGASAASVLVALNLADELEKIKQVAREKVDAQAAEIAALKKQLNALSAKPFPQDRNK